MKCLKCLEKHSYAFIYIRNDSLNDERGEMKGQTETQLLRQHFCCDPLITVVHSLNHTARRFQRLDPILNGTAR